MLIAHLMYMRSDANTNGWSAVGGQTQSAYLRRKPDEIVFGQTVRQNIRHAILR